MICNKEMIRDYSCEHLTNMLFPLQPYKSTSEVLQDQSSTPEQALELGGIFSLILGLQKELTGEGK